MSETIKISIRDWMQLPEVLSLEDYYQNEGLLNHSWKDFKVVDSKKAYESYSSPRINLPEHVCKINHQVLAINRADLHTDNDLLRCMTGTLFALRIAAENTKIEGYPVFSGKLIIQDRMPITIETGSDEIRGIMWYGAIFKIGDNYELH